MESGTATADPNPDGAHDVMGQASVYVCPTRRAFSGAEVAKLVLTLPTLGLHVDLMLCRRAANAVSGQSGPLQMPVELSCLTNR